MSGGQSVESERAFEQYKDTANQYYKVALPALKQGQDSAFASLSLGESQLQKDAFNAQRSALTNSFADKDAAETAARDRAEKGMVATNPFSGMNPTQIGTELANALWGSKFQEGQAGMEQRFGFVNSLLGGSASTGSGALNAAGQDLNAIRFMPTYNTTEANILGLANTAGSIYGAINQPSGPWASVGNASQYYGNNPAAYTAAGLPSWVTSSGAQQ